MIEPPAANRRNSVKQNHLSGSPQHTPIDSAWSASLRKVFLCRLTRLGKSDGSRIGKDTQPPSDEPPTHFAYDPRNPVPSIGGNANHRGIHTTISSGAVLREGSFDQRPVENRRDVLVFTTGVLDEDVEVIGPVSMKLYAASDARDTDFTVVLIDVQVDGAAMNVTEGIMRARFRETIWETLKLLTPVRRTSTHWNCSPRLVCSARGTEFACTYPAAAFRWDRNTNTWCYARSLRCA
jgi:predicted acyl esterase